ncbi:MAG: hypothetical protein GW789_18310, partial [Ignavibacteria bacterium]|nr:hypothetical protein [Ignavibacteria bacterium]
EHLILQQLNESKSVLQLIPETWEEMDELRKAAADNASRIVEKQFIENLLKKFNGNISQAALHIGINRTNLHKMIKKCEIKTEDDLS